MYLQSLASLHFTAEAMWPFGPELVKAQRPQSGKCPQYLLRKARP